MTENEFWKLIGQHVVRQSGGSIDARPLAKVLERKAPEEILAFQRHMSQRYLESYTWQLRGAAYLIHDGCPDDTFDYFRSWLIGCGRDVFLAAMENPDSLADFATPEAIDDLLYAVGERTYKKVTGQDPPADGLKRLQLKKDLDFRDPDDMARVYPRLFARFGGEIYAPNPYDDLLERCRRYAGAPKKRWSEDDVKGFFQRFRPSGEGLIEIYAGVEHGEEIARRIAAVMQVDGTSEGSLLSANKLMPVSGEEALALVKKLCDSVQSLAKELDDDELAERFAASEFKLRGGERQRFESNELTDETIDTLCQTLHSLIYESCAVASVLNKAIYELAGWTPMAFYIQWPVCAERYQTSDPLEPFFELWRQGAAWRVTENQVFEVFTP
jgi:hypothetical protein